jgi:hypothetical protein
MSQDLKENVDHPVVKKYVCKLCNLESTDFSLFFTGRRCLVCHKKKVVEYRKKDYKKNKDRFFKNQRKQLRRIRKKNIVDRIKKIVNLEDYNQEELEEIQEKVNEMFNSLKEKTK